MTVRINRFTAATSIGIVMFCLYALLFIWRSSFLVDGIRYFSLLDDAMISMRYAKNFAVGEGLVWNIGEAPVEGITNPLWALLMSVVHLLPIGTPKTSLIIQLFGLTILVGNLYVVARIAFFCTNSIWVISGSLILTGLSYSLNTWALQGMEVSILTLLISLAVHDVIRHKTLSSTTHVLLIAASLIRIDMIGTYVAFLILVIMLNDNRISSRLWIAFSFLCVITVAQTGLRYWYYGDVLPNTYYLKMSGSPITP